MDSNLFNKDLAADYLDCMSDYFEQEQEAIRETTQSDWSMVDRSNGIVEIDIMENQFQDWQLIEQPDDLSP